MPSIKNLLFLLLPTVVAHPQEGLSQESQTGKEQALGDEVTASRAGRKLRGDFSNLWNVYFTVDLALQLGQSGGRKCLERNHDRIVNMLNTGFNEAVGQSRFAGDISTVNDNDDVGFCDDDTGSRRLGVGRQHESGNQTSTERGGHTRGGTDVDSKNLRVVFPELDFHGGFQCRLCQPEMEDRSSSRGGGPTIQPPATMDERLDELAVDVGAHLTSTLQLSGIGCLVRRKPTVKATIQTGQAQDVIASSTCGR